MSAGSTRALAARQRARNRVFIAVAIAAATLDAAIIVVIVAGLTRSVTGLAAALGAVVIIVLISVVAAARPAARIRLHSRDAEESDNLVPVVARLAERLGVVPPVVGIIDDDAVNALSDGSGGSAYLFYTVGFLREFRLPADGPLVEAVTAHLLARVAARDNGVTVVANGVLNWASFFFDNVFMPLVRMLKTFGKGYLNSDNHHRLAPGDGVYSDDGFNRILIWVISVTIGLCLLLVSATVLLLGGILVAVARGVKMGLARQRIRVADTIAAELTDRGALGAALDRLSGKPIELDDQSVHDLCFAGDSRYYPDLDGRIARVLSPGETTRPGMFAPLASALAIIAVIGGAAVLATRIPYGHPFGGTPGSGSVALSAHANPASGGGGAGAAVPVQSSTQPAATPSPAASSSPSPAQSPAASQTAQPSPSPSGPPTPTVMPSPTPSPSPSAVTVKVVVPANGWTDTGITLHKGDLVTVSASGSWTADSVNYAGPDGYSAQSPDNFFNLADLGVCADCATTPAPHWGALISYTGTAPPAVGSYTSTTVARAAQRITLVGSHSSGHSPRTGEFWLGFNDDAYSGYTIDNSGQVKATITIMSGM